MALNFERYDKIVWRISGTLVLILCGWLLLGFVYVTGSYVFGKDHNRTDIVRVDQATQKKEYIDFGRAHHLEGTEFLLIPLQLKKTNSSLGLSSAKSYEKNTARNYMILNYKTNISFWVLKDQSAFVANYTLAFDRIDKDSKAKKTMGLLLELVNKDTNGDGQMDGRDKVSIYYYDLATDKLSVISEDLDSVIEALQADENSLTIMYSKTKKSYHTQLNIKTLLLSDEQEILVP
ncbi:MAG: hypothetical protein IT287_09005 [Bdellovibrionaceae bacterium]|nr:hypothetical protein [Pseudobdellovibrionaceae bacterium]